MMTSLHGLTILWNYKWYKVRSEGRWISRRRAPEVCHRN